MDEPVALPDPDAIKVGVLIAQSASYSSFGKGVEYAARLAAQEINAAGGVHGRKLEIVVANDKALPATGALGAESLVSQGVLGIVGASGSSVTLAAATKVTIPAGIALISPSSSSPAITRLADRDTVWRTIPSDTFLGDILASEARRQGVEDMGVLYIDNAYGAGLAEVFRNRFTALGGTMRSFVPYTDGKLIGFTAEVEALFSSGVPQGVLLIGYTSDSANITIDLQQAHPTPKPRFFSVDAALDPTFMANASSEIIEGMQGTVGAPPTDSPAFGAFAARYRQVLQSDPPLYSEGSYDSVYLMALAMIRGGTATKEAIVANLRPVSNPSGQPGDIPIGPGAFAAGVLALQAGRHVDYSGASGEIDFDVWGDVSKGTYIWWRVVRNAEGKLVCLTEKIIRYP